MVGIPFDEASYKVGYQEGMRKVVEWLGERHLHDYLTPDGHRIANYNIDGWQAFLKENGLEGA